MAAARHGNLSHCGALRPTPSRNATFNPLATLRRVRSGRHLRVCPLVTHVREHGIKRPPAFGCCHLRESGRVVRVRGLGEASAGPHRVCQAAGLARVVFATQDRVATGKAAEGEQDFRALDEGAREGSADKPG